MGDYYTENPAALRGQPKRTIAEYVRQSGVLVPHIYGSLDEALLTGTKFVARSEHEQDYAGCSGILDSPVLESDTHLRSESSIRRSMFVQNQEYKSFCDLMGISPRKFRENVSFSCWDFVEGHNATVVQDSAVSDRYHILSNSYPYSYLQVSQSGRKEVRDVPAQLNEAVEEMISVYNFVSGLDNFDSNHRAIMEMQVHSGQVYFLQYHRGRDACQVDFSLDRPLGRDEHKAVFVRGATPREGMVTDVTISYGALRSGLWQLKKEEAASADVHFHDIFSELMARKRKLQVLIHNTLEWAIMKALSGHFNVTRLFKPEVSMIISNDQFESLISREEHQEMIMKAWSTGEDQSIPLSVVSDGNVAYFRRV